MVGNSIVAADIEVVSSYEGTERAELWKEAFERSYSMRH
jgi:hypothetical protein